MLTNISTLIDIYFKQKLRHLYRENASKDLLFSRKGGRVILTPQSLNFSPDLHYIWIRALGLCIQHMYDCVYITQVYMYDFCARYCIFIWPCIHIYIPFSRAYLHTRIYIRVFNESYWDIQRILSLTTGNFSQFLQVYFIVYMASWSATL